MQVCGPDIVSGLFMYAFGVQGCGISGVRHFRSVCYQQDGGLHKGAERGYPLLNGLMPRVFIPGQGFQSLDSTILLTSSTMSDEEYLPPVLFITNPIALFAAFLLPLP